MCKNLKKHFDKYGKEYSLLLLLIIAVFVVLLFFKVESFDLEVSRVQNRADEYSVTKVVTPVTEEVVEGEGEEGAEEEPVE